MNYSREIKPARNRKEGLINCLQMIINLLEQNNIREAIYLAVDTIESISQNVYEGIDPTEAAHILRIVELEDALKRALAYIRKGVELSSQISDKIELERYGKLLNRPR